MSRELTEKLLKVFVDTGDMKMSYRELAGVAAKEIERPLAQARAEVLAACVADVDAALAIFMENEGRSKDEKLLVGGTCLAIKNRLGELQPAAAALEELLEEARRKEGEKVRKEALLDILAFNSGLGCTPQEGYKWLVEALRDTQRLSIEKARVSEGKK